MYRQKYCVRRKRRKVYTSETLCCTGEEEGSPRKCIYTLGTMWSALEHA